MNGLIKAETQTIESMIYEIRGKQGMLDSEIPVTKCHNYFYDKIINTLILACQY